MEVMGKRRFKAGKNRFMSPPLSKHVLACPGIISRYFGIIIVDIGIGMHKNHHFLAMISVVWASGVCLSAYQYIRVGIK